jgi:hypothetical protein
VDVAQILQYQYPLRNDANTEHIFIQAGVASCDSSAVGCENGRDGTRISGSANSTIRLSDSQSGEMVFDPFHRVH